MELKLNMYVRTKHYGLFKILKIIKENSKTLFFKKQGHTVVIADKNNSIEEEIIGEPSYDIIDLIEAGDYVNGYLVIDNDIKDNLNEKYIQCGYIENNQYEDECVVTTFYNKDIKSIVTKEQFESMAYKVY